MYARNSDVDILLVEDSPGDVMLVTAALAKAKGINSVLVVGDGEAALDVLHRRGACSHAPRPHLILLDLDLPTIDGHEVLRRIKADPDLNRIPVVIFTTSSLEEDILTAYSLNANSFITKPTSTAEFLEVMASLEKFWLEAVSLPTR